jgi:hypothetical protein
LHQYLNDGVSSPALQEFVLGSSRSMPAAIVKSERRRSLPTRTSMLSIASEYSIATPKPEATDFQLRRRRAAKLMQFFGADYRVLIQDVLESIEKGLEDERKRGNLGPDEAEVSGYYLAVFSSYLHLFRNCCRNFVDSRRNGSRIFNPRLHTCYTYSLFSSYGNCKFYVRSLARVKVVNVIIACSIS